MLMTQQGDWGPCASLGSAVDPPCHSHNDCTSNRKATPLYNAKRYKMQTDVTILTCGEAPCDARFGPMDTRQIMVRVFLLHEFTPDSETYQAREGLHSPTTCQERSHLQ